MKNFFLLLVVLVSVVTTACKKDYDCSAIDPAGNETILKCENCSKNDVSDYEKSILDKGYTSADCAKK